MSSHFTFTKCFQKNRALLGLDWDTRTTNGNDMIYVKDLSGHEIFHTFKISQTSDINTVQYKRIQFRNYSKHEETHWDVNFGHKLMCHDGCLYWFADNDDERYPYCIVYDCNNSSWDIKPIIPTQDTIIVFEKDWSLQSYFFVSYLEYAIFVGFESLNDNEKCDVICVNTSTMTYNKASIDYNSLNDPAACTIVEDHYLLVLNYNKWDPSVCVMDIDNIVDSFKLQSAKWTDIALNTDYNLRLELRNLAQLSSPCIGNRSQFLWYSQAGGDIQAVLGEIVIRNKRKKIMIAANYNHIRHDFVDWRVDVSVDESKMLFQGFETYYTNTCGNWYHMILVGNRIVAVERTCNMYISDIWHSGTKYLILRKIGTGGSAQVYSGTSLMNNNDIVIKQMNNTQNDVQNEEIIYKKLKENKLSWISCDLYESVREDKRTYLILEKLGLSLQHLMNDNLSFNDNYNLDQKMSLSQVLGILDRMFIILCKLHSIGYVHNDIKPENILIGINENQMKSNRIYLIDFGISTQFWDFKQNKHKPVKTNAAFNGTFRFASKNHHCHGFSTSRRDDLESLIYLGIYCLTGKLPWMVNYTHVTTKESILNKTKRLKQSVALHDICQGIPAPFEMALIYIQSLKYDEKPNYSYLQQLFRNLNQTELQTQLTTARKVTQIANNVSMENGDPNIAIIGNVGHHLGSIDFLGCRVPIAITATRVDNRQVETKEAELEVIQSQSLISQALTDIAVKQLNKMESNGTITNHPTHMSVHGMRNRFGYLIDSLTIQRGVPNTLPTQIGYGGIIVYKTKKSSAGNSILKEMSQLQLTGSIYMLSSSECELVNKEYTKKTGHNLGGIVHGAVYYRYFKKSIFDVSKNENKLSFIRGFSFPANGPLKCRSGAFNFIGYKLIDDKYKPLAKCEEKFIDCALRRYWNNNNENETSFQQFVDYDQYKSANKHANSDDNIHINNQLVPHYSDNDVDCNVLPVYSKVKLLWMDNIVLIIDYLNNGDKLKLFYLSKQARLLMNQYCLWISNHKHQSTNFSCPWYYVCEISAVRSDSKSNKTEKTARISIQTNTDSNIYNNRTPTVDLRTWKFATRDDLASSGSNCRKFLLVNYHPLWDILRQKDLKQHSLHRIQYNQNLKYLILLKCFGIYNFENHLIFGNPISLSFIVNQSKYVFQPEWSWQRNGEWMQYDSETCLQIENSYRDGDASIILSKGMYKHGQYQRLYQILFNCKHGNLKASNQSQVDDIYNDKKWRENVFCKFFYQQNVENKWVRIVRRKMTLKQEAKNCIIM